MQDSLYREIILEHWQHPQNYGIVKDANIDTTDVNPLCGDEIHITAKLVDGTIKNIAFKSQGCAISKASASLFTEEMKGKTIEEIKKIKPEDVVNLLEVKLTPARTKCALLVYTTLNKGLADRSSS
jgi:nitrogen fixation NifU-like protein